MAKILVVDDEQDLLDFMKPALEKKGYEVETASSGEEALEKVKEHRPHLMLLDIRMPGMGGIETLKQAKEIDPRLGVIMVTAVHDEEVAKRAMEFGAHDYVTKPIDFNYLNLTVMTKIVDLLG
ncbi:response regulator [Nitrospinota bacterium]